MKFSQIPSTTFRNLQLNAGMLLDNFDPATGSIPAGTHLLGATSGGINFTATPSFTDFGEDVDNCPKNTKELMRLDNYDVNMSGNFVSADAATVKMLNALGDSSETGGVTKIVPRNELAQADFKTVWWVGDYSDVNTGDSAGFMAIKLMNALNTGGFAIQSGDKAKGQFAFTFKGHFSVDAQDTVPYEIYIKEGTAETIPSIELETHRVVLAVGGTYTFSPVKVPSDASVTWNSGTTAKATVNSSGKVTAVAEGSSIITASITVDGVTYNDTCTVIVQAAS